MTTPMALATSTSSKSRAQLPPSATKRLLSAAIGQIFRNHFQGPLPGKMHLVGSSFELTLLTTFLQKLDDNVDGEVNLDDFFMPTALEEDFPVSTKNKAKF